ncbi:MULTISPECIES: HAD-IIA family hydrolase [unclassified Corynebacterium]|uniref:HAD-IIA family hydrolase n=1 Tax=unclassified Corynebacterium TaxID=2624378 RepID=UPI0034CF76F6
MASLLESHDSLLLDLDGTVWEGDRPIGASVDIINACGLPCVYITNNASRSPGAVVDKLVGMGIKADAEHVLTSAQACLKLASEELPAGATVLVIGAESFRQLARQAGFNVVTSADDNPQAVLQGFDPAIGWAELTEAALAIRNGAKFYASNLDTSLPMERGLAVGNGSLVAAVSTATGVEPASAGKPAAAMFTQAVQGIGSKAPLAVGDRLDTDIQGGNAAGVDTFHVLTGVSGPLALIEAEEDQRPNFIGESLQDINLPEAELRPGAQGGFHARVDGEDIILSAGDPGATPVQALRTVLEVAWAMPHSPRYVRPVSDAADQATGAWW